MRNPYKSVLDNSALRSLGLKIRAAWETLVRRKPSALRVAENYGTPHCQFDENIIKEWKDTLKKLVGANAPPVLSIEGKLEYKPPLNAEIIEAWVERGGDKETQVPKWIKHGAPLGIEVPIGTCGIFPPADVEGPGVATETELEDASAQLPKGEILNGRLAERQDRARQVPRSGIPEGHRQEGSTGRHGARDHFEVGTDNQRKA